MAWAPPNLGGPTTQLLEPSEPPCMIGLLGGAREQAVVGRQPRVVDARRLRVRFLAAGADRHSGARLRGFGLPAVGIFVRFLRHPSCRSFSALKKALQLFRSKFLELHKVLEVITQMG